MYESIRFYQQIETPSFVATPPTAGPYVGPGDVVASATAWWGLRAYSLATVGTAAIRLRRDSDNTESDFNTLTNGTLDVASVTTFKGVANLFVTTLYDQIGVNHMIQATAAKQPKFTLSVIGSRPAMQDNGAATTLLQTTNAMGTIPEPYTFSTAYDVTTSNDGMIGIGALSAYPQVRVDQAGANTISLENLSSGFTKTAADSTWHALQAVFNGASSDANIDGTVNTGTESGESISNFKFDLFSFDGSSNFFKGNLVEFGLWAAAFTSGQSSSMSSNQHTYWGF